MQLVVLCGMLLTVLTMETTQDGISTLVAQSQAICF